MMTTPMIEFKNVSCRYGAVPVLDALNLRIDAGQFVGILGPSGAGKTTLLKAILGLIKPSSGDIFLKGERLHGQGRQRVGYVPQVEVVDWNFPLTVEQAVLLGRATRSGWLPWVSKSDRRQAVSIMEQLGIAHLSQRHIRELSGGQQQRVFLARALFAEPELLVLDEPTAGVDMRTQEDILHLLADLNRAGVTILMTTHDLNATAAHIPWVVCLNRTVVAQGTPETVFTPEILNVTYQGDMLVIKQEGLIFVLERPHTHDYHHFIPDPARAQPTLLEEI